MSFEIEGLDSLDATSWTATSITPFGPAPGAGRGLGFGGDALQRRPRRAATLNYESGFAAEAVVGPDGTANFEDQRIQAAKWQFVLAQRPVAQGEIPSALVQLVYTDRGLLTLPQLDGQVAGLLKRSGFKVSKATKFEALPVAWKWQKLSGGIYVPVVKAPVAFVGTRYSGSALMETPFREDPAILAKLPSVLYVYTFAVTSDQNTLTDADGARLLTLLKQAYLSLDSAKAYGRGYVTLLGSLPSLFNGDGPYIPNGRRIPTPGPIVWVGSAIALIIAANVLTSGTERRP
jgi:hypothetical protein